MRNAFKSKTTFNSDISKWDVSNVVTLSCMFGRTDYPPDNYELNANLSAWQVGKVTDMSYMFAGIKFNGDLSKWDVSNVKTMYSMFGTDVGRKFFIDGSVVGPLCQRLLQTTSFG